MVNPRGSQVFWQPKLLPFVAMAAMPADSRRRQARQPLAALKIMIVQTCPDDLLYTFSLCLCTLVCTNKEREMRTGSQCLLVHCHCCCCCCSLGPFVIAHRIMCFLLFPLFFAVFSLFHCAKNAGFFALLFWVGGLGFWGVGFWVGWVSGEGWGGA